MYEDGVFPLENIECLFQNAELDEYPQHGSKGEFVPYLSIIDALFNVGAEETFKLVNNATKHWKTWEEMVLEYVPNPTGGGNFLKNPQDAGKGSLPNPKDNDPNDGACRSAPDKPRQSNIIRQGIPHSESIALSYTSVKFFISTAFP